MNNIYNFIFFIIGVLLIACNKNTKNFSVSSSDEVVQNSEDKELPIVNEVDKDTIVIKELPVEYISAPWFFQPHEELKQENYCIKFGLIESFAPEDYIGPILQDKANYSGYTDKQKLFYAYFYGPKGEIILDNPSKEINNDTIIITRFMLGDSLHIKKDPNFNLFKIRKLWFDEVRNDTIFFGMIFHEFEDSINYRLKLKINIEDTKTNMYIDIEDVY